MNVKKKELYTSFFCFLAAFISLLICSKCSPLYPLNDWVDINVFYTIGKGMMNGKILYAELMDHKGPYTYAVAGIASLIDKDGFWGYFILEVISMGIFLIYIRKIVKLYVKKEMLCLFSVLVAGISASQSFVHGGSMEELSLGLFAYSLYSILRLLHTGEEIKGAVLVKNGVLAGILFWSKFTVVGFYVAYIAVIFFYLMFQRKIKKAIESIVLFLSGMLLATIPWIIYFGMNDAIDSWLKVYIWDNVFGYAKQSELGVFQKIADAVKIAFNELKDRDNWVYSLFVAFGGMGFLLAPKNNVNYWEKIAVLLMGLLMVIGIYIGGNVQDYYSLPMAVFAVLGIVVINGGCDWLQDRLPDKIRKKLIDMPKFIRVLVCLVVVGISNVGGYFISSNTYLLGTEKSALPQYRFAEIMEQSEDTSMLNYAFLDGGFYTVMKQVPKVRYFCTMNMNYENLLQIQNGYLEQQLTNWVVTWKPTITAEEELRTIPVLSEYYELVDYQYYYMEEDIRTYALYEKKK